MLRGCETMFGECHAHLLMDGSNYKAAVELHREQVQDWVIINELDEYSRRGISFIRDGGDACGVSKRARQLATEKGMEYRTPIFAIHKRGHYGSIVGNSFTNMKEYRGLVERVREEKGDFIKIMVSGIVNFQEYGKITGIPLNQAEIHEMIHIAHEEGFAVMVHANGAEAVLASVLAGADSIEHGNYLDDTCLEVMAQSDTVWVPTIVTIKNLMGCGRYQDEVLKSIYDSTAANIWKAFHRGVSLALGSDAGAHMVMHGQGLEDELQAFLQILSKEDKTKEKEVIKFLKQGEAQIRSKFKII